MKVLRWWASQELWYPALMGNTAVNCEPWRVRLSGTLHHTDGWCTTTAPWHIGLFRVFFGGIIT